MKSLNLDSAVTELKGVGARTAGLLAGRGIVTAGDIVRYYPSRYEECKKIVSVTHAQEGQDNALFLTVIGRGTTARAGGRTISHFRAGDATGDCRLTYYNMPYMVRNLPPGSQRVFRGVVKRSPKGIYSMDQPRVYTLEEYHQIEGTLQPVYHLFQGMKNRQMMTLTRKALEALPAFYDYLPEKNRARYGLCNLDTALRQIHYPSNMETLGSARNRLIFDEFFEFILGIRRQKAENQQLKSADPMHKTELTEHFLSVLPYSLTNAQKRAWSEIERDLTGEYVMNRLLQGDVGSGKTVLAFLALLLCSANGRQGALMAPTEVLAQQHMQNLSRMREEYDLPIHPVLLTGSVKGAQRRKIYDQIASGEADIVIGTHALIQEAVEYSHLGLVITDEQHRFGVRQRESLAGKGRDVPVLVMSATPIPRTLAIILYGDLKISILNEMPPGRLPIKNLAIDTGSRPRVYKFMYGQLRQGRQAYVICPEVEEGDSGGLENVTDYTKKLRGIFPEDVRIESLHGRMKPREKNDIMERFGRHEIDILVSTTVIEVGIDVPNATVILIENADRFGMSQLHQLRGRVGRGNRQSYCVFLYAPAAGERKKDEGGKPKRLEILEHTNDGFKIAEEDLKLRGPGDLFGVRQSGELGFELADIYEDAAVMKKAAACVDEMLAENPDYEKEGMRQVDFRSI